MITFKSVSKRYPNGVAALDQLDLFIGREEFVYLIGESGAGKSTLLKLLFRTELPNSGDILIDNFCLNRLQAKQVPLLRRHVGMIFQDYQLLPRRTVYENISFALMAMRFPARQIRRRVLHVLELVGLSDKLQYLPKELSGGEQQKICIARAIVNNPPILLCDEPTGNLDPDTSWEIVQLLTKINEFRKTTVLMATHDTDIVDGIPKRVVEIQKGRIVRDEALGGYIES